MVLLLIYWIVPECRAFASSHSNDRGEMHATQPHVLHIPPSSYYLQCWSGLISAYIIKTMYFGRHSTDREIAIVVLMAYLSYILAEACFCNNMFLQQRLSYFYSLKWMHSI